MALVNDTQGPASAGAGGNLDEPDIAAVNHGEPMPRRLIGAIT